MQCAAHADRIATHTVGGEGACEDCVASAQEQRETIGGALLIIVSVAYLITLAIGYLLFKGRPIVGGLAAVVALVFGRAVQVYLQRSVIRVQP